MNKGEFLAALEAELQNITTEERDEALKFYNEYLDEAGPENEARVLGELGEPRRVANIIRANLGAGVPSVKATAKKEAPKKAPKKSQPELIIDGPDWAAREQKAEQPKAPQPEAPSEEPQAEPAGPYAGPAYSGTGRTNTANRNNNLLWVVILFVTSPIWGGLLLSVLGLILGLFVSVLGFAFSGVAMVFSGIFAFIRALFLFASSPANALVNMGISLAASALGALITALSIWLASVVAPGFFKLIGRVVRAIFGKVGGK